VVVIVGVKSGMQIVVLPSDATACGKMTLLLRTFDDDERLSVLAQVLIMERKFESQRKDPQHATATPPLSSPPFYSPHPDSFIPFISESPEMYDTSNVAAALNGNPVDDPSGLQKKIDIVNWFDEAQCQLEM